jgi:integrase
MAREGVPLIVIQRQLGHSNLGITSVYLQGIDKRRNHRNRPCSPRPDDRCHHVAAPLTATPR